MPSPSFTRHTQSPIQATEKIGKGNKPNTTEVMTDKEVNILSMKNLLGVLRLY